MQAATRGLVLLNAALALFACAQSPDKPSLVGYTCCNLHFENEWISDANWSALPMLAAGTPVSVLEYEKYRVIAEVAGRRMKLGLDYGRKQDLDEWVRRLIVPGDPKSRIAQWPTRVRDAVQHGKVAIGMTKEQVIASVGYPPAHETPSLDAAQWRYWYGKLDSYLVAWDEAGRVKEVIAEPETRAAAMQQKATWNAKIEGQPASLSGEQRAAMRSASIADAVAMPDKPNVKSAQSLLLVTGGGIAPAISAGLVLLQIAAGQVQNEAGVQAFKKLMDDHQVDLASIVRGEFAGALAESRTFNEIVANKGDARFQVKVETYGIADLSAGKDNAPFPQLFLRLVVELSDAGGDVVWRQSAGHASLEALADPTQMNEGFKKVAQVAVRELLRDLPSFGKLAQPPDPTVSQVALTSTGVTGTAAPQYVGPLPVAGTIWVYGFADRMYRARQTEVTVRVLRTESNMVEEAITTNAQGGKAAMRVVEARAPRFLEHSLGGNGALIEIAPYLLAAHEGKGTPQILSSTGYPLGQAGLAPWVITAREKGWQRITVPAGSFQALRFELDGRRQRDVFAPGQIGRFNVTVWYSPEVKRFVRLEHKTWSAGGAYLGGQQNSHDVLELVAYRPPP